MVCNVCAYVITLLMWGLKLMGNEGVQHNNAT